jgi:hypothetical protein
MFLTVTNLTASPLAVGFPVSRTLAASGDPGDSVTLGVSREDLLFGEDQGRPAFKELDMLVQKGKATVTVDADSLESSVMFQADRSPAGLGSTVVADATALKAIGSADRTEGDVVILASNRSQWRFSAASTAADTTENFVLTPAVGTGRWLRTDKSVDLKLAISFATADAAVLFAVPSGFRLQIDPPYWETTADWTGGAASAIGASSSQAPHTTKGDLLGGATGDVAADLEAADGVHQGTIGTSFSADPKKVILEAGATIRHDRITSAFTAGTGFVHAKAQVVS